MRLWLERVRERVARAVVADDETSARMDQMDRELRLAEGRDTPLPDRFWKARDAEGWEAHDADSR